MIRLNCSKLSLVEASAVVKLAKGQLRKDIQAIVRSLPPDYLRQMQVPKLKSKSDERCQSQAPRGSARQASAEGMQKGLMTPAQAAQRQRLEEEEEGSDGSEEEEEQEEEDDEESDYVDEEEEEVGKYILGRNSEEESAEDRESDLRRHRDGAIRGRMSVERSLSLAQNIPECQALAPLNARGLAGLANPKKRRHLERQDKVENLVSRSRGGNFYRPRSGASPISDRNMDFVYEEDEFQVQHGDMDGDRTQLIEEDDFDYHSTVVFPARLPVMTLPDNMRSIIYGLTGRLSYSLSRQLEAFQSWETELIDTTRTGVYCRPIQSTTFEWHESAIRGYLGFAVKDGGLRDTDARLEMYANPLKISRFIAYLIARGAKGGYLTKHLGLAKKVNAYLASLRDIRDPAKNHNDRMQGWLDTLERQISLSVPPPELAPLPERVSVVNMANWKADAALENAEGDLASMGTLLLKTARQVICRLALSCLYNITTRCVRAVVQVHDAIMLSLVIGVEIPPPRLWLIKHLLTPAFAKKNGCQDRDCLHILQGESCKGNRLVIYKIAEDDRDPDVVNDEEPPSPALAFTERRFIKLFVEHGKNDRRRSASSYQIDFDIPKNGRLHQLLLVYIRYGYGLLTHTDHGYLFVNRAGKPMDNATFCAYWIKLLKAARSSPQHRAVEVFPPSRARKMFVTDFQRRFGHEPDLLEGASAIMGNTPDQWNRSYNPARRRDLARAAVSVMAQSTGCISALRSHQRPSGH